MFPAFEVVRRHRPVAIVAPGLVQVSSADPGARSEQPCPRPGPSAAVQVTLPKDRGPVELVLRSGDVVLTARLDGRRVSLAVDDGRRRTEHASRRHGRTGRTATGFALILTGTVITAMTCENGAWIARGRVDLADPEDPRVETRTPSFLERLHVGHRGEAVDLRAGAFGQLGLRDVRAVTDADGHPYRDPEDEAAVWLTATSAGPGFFPMGHTSVWRLDPTTYDLAHTGDVWFRRDGLVHGDHATHLLRDGEEWLVATSTWAGFRAPAPRRDDPGVPVGVALARTHTDPRHGEPVIDADTWRLPTDALASVGVWDPHLVRRDGRWLVGFVSARKYFDFHPALAEGPALDRLTLRSAATERRATEGTTIVPLADRVVVVASDGRDNPRGLRGRYPVLDLGMREVETLRSTYGTNLPWPTLIPLGEEWLHVAFDGTPYGGRLPGYGTHGDLVVSRSCHSRGEGAS